MFARSFFRILLAAVLLVPTARAEQTPIGAEVERGRRDAFVRGLEAMRGKDWATARAIYEELWSERRTYDVALQLGQVFLNLNDYRSAAEYLEFGLRNAAPREKVEVIERSRQLYALSRKEIATLDISVDQPDAEILVDGVSIGVSPLDRLLFVPAGEHQIEARKAGFSLVAETVQSSAGGEYRVDLRLTPLPPAVPASGPELARPPARPAVGPAVPVNHDRAAASRVSWVPVYFGAAATLVGAASGIGFAMAASADEDEARRLLDRVGNSGCRLQTAAPSDCASLRELAESYDRNRAISTAGIVVAGVGAAATLTYFFVARPDREPERSSSRLVVEARADADAAQLFLSGTF